MPLTLDQILATLAVDGARAYAVTERYAIIMRDPQPDEAGVPVGSTVYLRVADLEGDPANPAYSIDFKLYVDQGAGWVEAYNGTAPLHPWDGALALAVDSTGADPYCWREVTVDQAPAVFASEALVNVRVDIRIGHSGWGMFSWGHETWGHPPSGVVTLATVYYDFTAADVTPPNLLAAVAVGPRTVRVTFDDAMATGAGMVDDTAAWTTAPAGFTCNNVDPLPGVALTATAAAAVPDTGGTEWDISTDRAMTPGCPYAVRVSTAVTDDAGNAIATATTAFTGYTPDQPLTRFWDYGKFGVPLKNRLEDTTRDLERFTNCIGEALAFLTVQVDHWTDAFDPDLCTDADMAALLYAVGNPFDWADLELDATQQRKMLRVLVDIYRLKGTARGIEDVILFLLGEVVHVVDALTGGWVLGVDELGEGSIARLACDACEPYDFSGAPSALALEVDGVAQTVTLELADFATPAAATAAEVVAALDADLAGAGAYVDVAGSPAVATVVGAAPYALTAGKTVELEITGVATTVTFHAADFAVSGAATALEVAARFALDCPACAVSVLGGVPILTTLHRGADARIAVTGGTGLVPLGWTTASAWDGTDAPRVAIYSATAGADASIAVTGGAANAVLDFAPDPETGTGGAVLGPSTAATLYSFDIETTHVLSSAEEAIVRRIVDWMKPAHTHLVNVRTALPLPWPEGWELGVDGLDDGTELA